MNEHEEKLIASFISKEKQGRYRFLLESADPKRRHECLERLNHCYDLNEKYVIWLPRDPRSSDRDPEIAAILRQKGAPKSAYVLGSGGHSLDGQIVPLLVAMGEATRLGWGALISCVPGELAYYFDEEGGRRAILERKLGT